MPGELALVVVGAPKSGSTALLHHLADHPRLRTHVHPEMPFFGRPEEFARGWEFALRKYFDPSPDDGPVVAKHTMAMYDPESLRRIAGSTSAVVVAVLRDPVPRAYSHYRYARLRGWEDAPTFEEGLAREAARPVSSPPLARDLQYVGDGIYAPHVRNLLELVPPERLRIYPSGRMRQDAGRITAELFALAGLPPHEPSVVREHNEGRVPRSPRLARLVFAVQQPGNPLRSLASRYVPSRALYRTRRLVNRLNEGRGPVPPMSPETEARLRERFAAPDAELARLLGPSFTTWKS
ncbi:sulfotransferase domain-containing protein [Blastococcus sp. SYSU DS0533]